MSRNVTQELSPWMGISWLWPVPYPAMAELLYKMKDAVLLTFSSPLLKWKKQTCFGAVSCAAWIGVEECPHSFSCSSCCLSRSHDTPVYSLWVQFSTGICLRITVLLVQTVFQVYLKTQNTLAVLASFVGTQVLMARIGDCSLVRTGLNAYSVGKCQLNLVLEISVVSLRYFRNGSGYIKGKIACFMEKTQG